MSDKTGGAALAEYDRLVVEHDKVGGYVRVRMEAR